VRRTGRNASFMIGELIFLLKEVELIYLLFTFLFLLIKIYESSHWTCRSCFFGQWTHVPLINSL